MQLSLLRVFLPFYIFLFTCLQGNEECVFCNGRIESQQVYKSRYWQVLVDYKPQVEGHLLIIPLAHRLTRYDLTQEEHGELFSVENMVHCAIRKRFGKDMEDLQYEKNSPALQSVHHFHIHVLPIDGKTMQSWWAKLNFSCKLFLHTPAPLTEEELGKEQQAYQKAFAECAAH